VRRLKRSLFSDFSQCYLLILRDIALTSLILAFLLEPSCTNLRAVAGESNHTSP